MSIVRIAVVFHSGRGHTRRQAEAVRSGVEAVAGVETLLFPVEEAAQRWDDLAAAEAIVFGAPTYMGGPSAAFKAFAEASSRAAMAKGLAHGELLHRPREGQEPHPPHRAPRQTAGAGRRSDRLRALLRPSARPG